LGCFYVISDCVRVLQFSFTKSIVKTHLFSDGAVAQL